MNHIRRTRTGSSCTVFNSCHPERSLATSEASRQRESKDPVRAESATGVSGNFRIVVRFFDEKKGEFHHDPSREAAEERSPRRNPWVEHAAYPNPEGAKETTAGQERNDSQQR